MSQPAVQNQIIEGHRQVIRERYDPDRLIQEYGLPPSFTKDRIEALRTFFLEHVYPNTEKRKALDDAFESLDNYIKDPGKLLRILMDSGSLLFRYGRHLPGILKAGLKAMKSFRAATLVESRLTQMAEEHDMAGPFSVKQVRDLMTLLPKEEMLQMVNHGTAMNELLFDKDLIKNILKIVNHLISKMERRPNIYGDKEINGMKIGRDLILHTDGLFRQFSHSEQRFLVDLIERVELDDVESLYEH